MNFENYTPDNFDLDKMNAFKCLWLFNRRQQYFMERLRSTYPKDKESWIQNDPIKGSFEQLQRETGMMTEDLWNCINVGSYINEYIEFTQMTQQEFEERIQIIETNHEIDEEDREMFKELWDGFDKLIEKNIERDNTFKEIIHDNFNNQEEWTDGE